MSDEPTCELSDADRRRIRAEMRYARLVRDEDNSTRSGRKNIIDRIFGYLSNGFVLLIAGALITSWLIPQYQRQREAQERQIALMRDCYAQFQLYANSIWEEYYATFPLIYEQGLDQDRYIVYLTKISEIKLRRYDAYAKVTSLAIVFRNDGLSGSSKEEKMLHAYAVRINQISEKVDTWLRNLYCFPAKCMRAGQTGVDVEFSSYGSFLDLQDSMQEIQEEARGVSEMLVARINSVK